MAGSTTYQYILSLNDKMSGTLRKAGMEGGKTYDSLQSKQERLNNTANGFTSILGKIGIAFSAFEIGKKVLTAGADIEATRIRFQTLLQDVEKGNAMVQQLQDFANVTPFETTNLQDAAAMLLNFGVSADKVMGSLKMLGDVSGGDSEKLRGLTLAFSQMSSTGRLMGQDLLQMVNAGFNPLQEISRTTGRAMGDLKKDMEKGLISTAMVEEAFRSATSEGGRFYGMMDKMGQTIKGRWSTLMDKISLSFMKFGESTNSSVAKIIDSLINMSDWVFKNTDLIIKIAKAAMYAAAAWGVWKLAVLAQVAVVKAAVMWQAIQLVSINVLGDGFLKASVAQKIFAAAQWAINAAMSANPIALIVIGIAALILLIYKAVKAYDKWGAAAMLLLGPIGMIVNLVMALKNNWDSIVSAFKDGGILQGLKRIGIVLLDVILYPVQQLLQLLSRIPGLGKLAGNGAEWIAKIRKNLDLVTPTSKQTQAAKATSDGTDLIGPVLAGSGGAGAGAGTDGSNPLSGTSKGITGGGSRPTNINITLGNLVETITITPATLKEGAGEIERLVSEALLRALNSANRIAVE